MEQKKKAERQTVVIRLFGNAMLWFVAPFLKNPL